MLTVRQPKTSLTTFAEPRVKVPNEFVPDKNNVQFERPAFGQSRAGAKSIYSQKSYAGNPAIPPVIYGTLYRPGVNVAELAQRLPSILLRNKLQRQLGIETGSTMSAGSGKNPVPPPGPGAPPGGPSGGSGFAPTDRPLPPRGEDGPSRLPPEAYGPYASPPLVPDSSRRGSNTSGTTAQTIDVAMEDPNATDEQFQMSSDQAQNIRDYVNDLATTFSRDNGSNSFHTAEPMDDFTDFPGVEDTSEAPQYIFNSVNPWPDYIAPRADQPPQPETAEDLNGPRSGSSRSSTAYTFSPTSYEARRPEMQEVQPGLYFAGINGPARYEGASTQASGAVDDLQARPVPGKGKGPVQDKKGKGKVGMGTQTIDTGEPGPSTRILTSTGTDAAIRSVTDAATDAISQTARNALRPTLKKVFNYDNLSDNQLLALASVQQIMANRGQLPEATHGGAIEAYQNRTGNRGQAMEGQEGYQAPSNSSDTRRGSFPTDVSVNENVTIDNRMSPTFVAAERIGSTIQNLLTSQEGILGEGLGGLKRRASEQLSGYVSRRLGESSNPVVQGISGSASNAAGVVVDVIGSRIAGAVQQGIASGRVYERLFGRNPTANASTSYEPPPPTPPPAAAPAAPRAKRGNRNLRIDTANANRTAARPPAPRRPGQPEMPEVRRTRNAKEAAKKGMVSKKTNRRK